MANLTKNEKYIVDMYVRYFGKAPSKAEIAKYNDFKTPKLILTEIRGDADDTKPLNTKEFVNNAFQNLFGRDATTKEMNKYSKVVDAGKDLPINAIVKAAKKSDKGVYEAKKAIAIMLAEKENTTNYNLDKITKDTYADVYNLKTKKLLVDSVAQLETKIDAMPDNVSGTTFNLTTGIDTLVGTEKGDVFNAVQTGTAFVLGALDTIDGGAGVDTLNVQDTTTVAGSFNFGAAAIKNVENINVTTNGDFTDLNTTAITGLTSFTGKAAGTVATTLTVADTTAVALTLGTTADSSVSGGTSVNVTKGATAIGALDIKGKALTDVTVKGGTYTAAVTSDILAIDNLENTVAATSGKGTTLKTVTLDGVAGTDAGAITIKGAAIDTLVLKNQIAVQTTTITNDTSTSLTIKADGVGYTAAGAAVTNTVNAGSKAATLNVEATGAKSALTLTGTAAKTVNITGTAALDLAQIATATKIDGSAATGNLTLNTLNAITVDVKTGAGNDKFTATTTNKLTIDTGAGNDIVTLTGALVAGSTIKLGAGNDTLLGTTVAAASTASAVTTIDGGDGIDSVSSALINAGNAAQFVNFENVSLQGSNLDLALMTKSTITGLSIDAAATTVVSNATQSQSLTVNASGTSSTIGFTGVTGTADAYAITFNSTSTGTALAPTTISAGTVVVNGIENVTIHSNAAAGVAQNSITLTDSTLQTLSIDGSQDLTVAFAGTNGTVTAGVGGVSSIDASAATGKISVNLANVKEADAGITVKGGSAADILTTQALQSATLTGNGGNDSFVVADTVYAAGKFVTTITDFTKGDTITFKAVTGTTTFTSTKVDVSLATNLADALDLAAATNVTLNDANFTWFNYGGNTYIVQDLSTATTLATTDVVVKLNGVYDFSTGATASATEVFSWA